MRGPEVAAAAGADFALLGATVREAGALARDLFRRGVKAWTKGDHTPVSEADLAVDRLLRERLTQARPEYGWLSEETADDPIRLGRRRAWIADPIDGTRGFLAGEEEWCVSVGLVEEGRPVLAAVYNPITDEFFAAARGEGARLNERPIRVSACAALEGCRILAGASVLRPHRWADAWPAMQPATIGSLAWRLCRVAEGQWDAMIAAGSKSEWDTAAADLILSEAQGHLTDFNGNRLRYNQPAPRHRGLVAAGPRLHPLLIARTRAFKG